MEEIKASLGCQNCDRTCRIRFYCKNHSQQLCFKCATTLHLECQREDIEEQANVRDSIMMVREGLSEIIQEAEELLADSHIQNFSCQIEKYQEALQILENKFKNAVDENRCYEYKAIVNEALCLQTSLINSKVFQNLSKYKHQRLRSLDGDWKVELGQDDMSAVDFKRFRKLGKQEITKEIHKISQQACEQALKENHDKLQKMQEKVRIYELQIAQLEQENSKLTEEIKEKVQEEEDKQGGSQLENNSEEEKQTKKRNNEELFNLIYQRNTGSQASDLTNSTLTFSLNDAKSKAFFDDIATAKIEISKVKRINVNFIGDCNPNLSLFLANSIPQNLGYLCLNWNAINVTPIKLNYYISSLVTAMKKVTKEAFINLFELNISDLQEVVKAGYNSERVVIRYSSLKCSSAMDFTTSNIIKYFI